MRGFAFALTVLLAASAQAGEAVRAAGGPSNASAGADGAPSIKDSNAKGFNTGGAGLSEGSQGSEVPSAIKMVLTEEQRRQIKKGRGDKNLPPEIRKRFDEILNAPGVPSFERQETAGDINYHRPSGFDGARTKNEIGRSSLERSIPSERAAGREFQSSTGDRSPVRRGELKTDDRNFAPPRDLSKAMSPLEAASRRSLSQAASSPGSFRSLRDRPANFGSQPAVFATENRRTYRESERRARKRLRDAEDSTAYSALAQSQIGQMRFKEAREAADKALAANPRDADALALRAIASEQLGDEAAKMAALEEAARLNPKRFSTLLEQARGGMTLFDPSAADSWHLLGALAETPGRPFDGLPLERLVWIGLALVAFAVPVFAGASFYRRLSPDQQRTLASWWTKNVQGQAMPRLATTPVTVRRPDGPSIVKLEPGLRIADKYKLVRKIGMDGTVQVWKALDKVLDRPVLIKRLYERRTESGEWELRLAEAKKAATLHHPNVVDLYEILDMPIGLFVVYEYPSGKTLRDILREVGTLPAPQAIEILIPVCRALQHAHHRGIVHGALSPDRIVLTRQGYVKVTDFVLARTTASDAGACVAPEAKRGDPTRASDIYSLGASLHEIVTGAPPGEDGEQEPDALTEAVIGRALDLDSRTRIQSARVYQKELEELRSKLGGGGGPEEGEAASEEDSDQDDRGTRSETAA
jgi:tRNA A-37 threonylcarbamoyl transferase component Bud32